MLRRLPWPLPALLGWGTAWLLFLGAGRAGAPAALALGLATAWGVLCSLLGHTWWRRGWIAAGFPLSVVLTGTAAIPTWAWLIPLALCLLIYPLNAWRDAPIFPTPRHALAELPRVAPLPEGASLLDAGCGLGHGLKALRLAYPAARIHGIEWSWLLWAVCAVVCPFAKVRRGDIWRANWQSYTMVYLFQRPESMAKAWQKARSEMSAGAWMVSLEFAVPDVRPSAVLTAPDGRSVWLYQVPTAKR